ncbi:MAG: L,D-transpeptidase family protein [Bacteroidetes bacterium]|nr:L,D-transpeptidase family protein [Bacteroidota bacterium]
MTTLRNAKKTVLAILALIFLLPVVFMQSCKKKRTEMGSILYKHTHNAVYKNADEKEFAAVFRKVLATNGEQMANPQIIRDYYKKTDYEPVLVLNHLWNGDISSMLKDYREAYRHGINPAVFDPDQIDTLVSRINNKKAVKTTREAYYDIAKLEMLVANSLINYSSYLQYGILSPRKLFSRYFIKTERPDTTSMNKVFSVASIRTYLDSIQPKDPQYLALQKAYLEGFKAPKMSKEETRRILLVNMERLRWKNKPDGDRYVYVNIPDFCLDVMDSGRSVLNMKVCVGQGRNDKYQNTLEHYDDTCKVDNPNPHETPQLSSVIHSVQVNPIWNIPKSIATKEIIVQAAEDPYYLANKNINVYKDGKLIPDPEDIDWSNVTKENCPYEFKQAPGEENALGKIKFLFENGSSIYLHDTPAKDAFGYKIRAVSHGCVRLEKPVDLAHNLFRDTVKYNLIAKDMQEDDPTPQDIALRPRVPVYITYVTCWMDQNGQLQFRQDVYGHDIIIYDHLKKFLPQ